jgi:NADPH-dependent 2,4-dienoyl-CoA reductase/sulfur reductase-like enzyme
MKPDAVFVATGGILTSPGMTGARGRRVLTTPELHRRVKPYLAMFGPRVLGWLTRHFLPMGKTVVVIGGGLHGCEIAEFLTKRGRKVTIVESSDKVGEGVIDFRLGLLLSWFNRRGVKMLTGVREMEIVEHGLAYSDKDGKRQIIPADAVVPTSPLQAGTEVFEDLRGEAREVFLIGDARQPGMIVDAVRGAYQAARTL